MEGSRHKDNDKPGSSGLTSTQQLTSVLTAPLLENEAQISKSQVDTIHPASEDQLGNTCQQVNSPEKLQSDGKTSLEQDQKMKSTDTEKTLENDEQYFTRKLTKVIKARGLESSFYHLVSGSGNTSIKCRPCGILLSTGKREMALSNFSRHVSLENHKLKAMKEMEIMLKKEDWTEKMKSEQDVLSLKRKREEERKEAAEVTAKRVKLVTHKYSGIFEQISGSNAVMCKFCVKQLSLEGAFEHNIDTHVMTAEHISKAKACKPQASISSFFKKDL